MRFVPQVVYRCSVAFALTIGSLVATASHADAASPPPFEPTARASSGLRSFVGTAHVLDGDTLDLATRDYGIVRIRLEGIDAPEGGQRCPLKWYGTWDCGRAAATALTQMVRDRLVTCDDRGLDRYGRTLSVCLADGRDINSEMVRIGLAWAYVKYSMMYVPQEQDARAARIGVWQAPSEAPWDWRARQKAATSDVAQPLMGKSMASGGAQQPHGCTIKGNVTKSGRIYHTTDSPWYERVKMSLGFGRRWFCSEGEAQAAGWRPAVVQGP